MKKIVFWLFLFVWTGLQYWPVNVPIRSSTSEEGFSIRMPLRDKKRLEYFFREVCFFNAWGYTLMGSKPVSIHQYVKPWEAFRRIIGHPEIKEILLQCFWPPDFHEICYFFNPEQFRIKEGWDTLNKYIHYFPATRYSLCTLSSENSETVVIALVDKIKLVKVVTQYVEDFQEVLQVQRIKPEDLFEDEKLHAFLKGLNQDSLIGTVLGFGRENAWLFQKCRFMHLDPKERPMEGMWLDEEKAHLQKINRKARSFQPWDLSDLFYPTCVCDPFSEETEQLRRVYREEREKIFHYYRGKDVVGATLGLFLERISL